MYLCGFVACCKLHSWLSVMARDCWRVHGNSAYVAVGPNLFVRVFFGIVLLSRPVSICQMYFWALRILSLAPDDATRKRLNKLLPTNVRKEDILLGISAAVFMLVTLVAKHITYNIACTLQGTITVIFVNILYYCCIMFGCSGGNCVQKQHNFVQHRDCTLHAGIIRMCCYGACGSTMGFIGSQWDQQTCGRWRSWRNFSFIFIK